MEIPRLSHTDAPAVFQNIRVCAESAFHLNFQPPISTTHSHTQAASCAAAGGRRTTRVRVLARLTLRALGSTCRRTRRQPRNVFDTRIHECQPSRMITPDKLQLALLVSSACASAAGASHLLAYALSHQRPYFHTYVSSSLSSSSSSSSSLSSSSSSLLIVILI